MKRELKHIVEALIFASDEPIDTQTIVNIIKSVDKEEELELYSLVENAIEELNQFYEENGVAFRIIKIAKGYQFATRPEFSRIYEHREKTEKTLASSS